MSSEQSRADQRAFRRWTLQWSEELAGCGLPLSVWERYENWLHFLDHGYVDSSDFDLAQLSPAELRQLAELVKSWRGDRSETDVERWILAVERERLKARHEPLFRELVAYFYRMDPMQRRLGSNRDQYEPEVGTILPRVFDLDSAGPVARVVEEEIHRWWKDGIRSEHVSYDDLATGILEIMERHGKGRPRA